MKNDKITEEELIALKQAKGMLSGFNSEPPTLKEKLALLSKQILSILEPNVDDIHTEKKTSFYQENKEIFEKIDIGLFIYYRVLLSFSYLLKTKEYDKNTLNEYIKYNVFAPSIESSDKDSELKAQIKNDIAVITTACVDHGIKLDNTKLLPEILSQDITEILGEYQIYNIKADDILGEM